VTKPTGLQYHLATGAAWTDITPYVLYSSAVEINRGRQDQFSTVQTGTFNATLDNSDGRFAPGDGYKQGVNYITNPRFHNDLTGWTPSANLTAVWDAPSRAAKLTATSTAALTYQFTVALPVDAPGKTYWLTASINASGTAIGKTTLQKVEFYNAGAGLISTLTRVGAATLVSGWNTVATFMTVPAGAVTAKVFPLHVPGGWAVNDFVLLDNAAFTDYAAGRYFDGAQITWQDGATYNGVSPRDALGFFQFVKWNGIADASTSVLYRAIPYLTGMNTDNGIRARFPDTNNHNMVASAEDSSFEAGTVGTWTVVAGWGSIANSAVRAWDGTKSLLLTSSTTGSAAIVPVAGLVCGLTYTMQVRVWVLAGQPDVTFNVSGVSVPSVTTSLKAQWVTMTSTFTLPLGTPGSSVKPQVWWGSAGVAGQQVWVDGLQVWEGSTAPPAFITGPNPTYQDKFNGYLSAMPVQWPGGNNYSEVPITAADRLAPLARHSFKSVVQEEILYDNPAVYYTLGEPTGATSGGDTSGNGQQAMQTLAKGTTGAVSFGTGTGPPTDGLTAAQFSPTNVNNFKYLAAKYPQSISGYFDSKTIIATFNAPTAVAKQCLWRIFDQSHYWNTYDLGFDGVSLGKLTLNWGGGPFTMTSPNRYDDGQTHQVAITFTPGVYPNIALTMYVDGVQVATTAAANAAIMTDVVYLQLGGDTKYNQPFIGTMSHVAVFQSALSAARILAQSTAQKNGFVNERSDQRIARYARWAGLTAAEQTLETGKLTTTDHLDTAGQSAASAFETVAAAEGGLVFVDRSGDLAFHSRTHRWDAAPFITLGPDDVGKDTQPTLDNQLLINQVTSSSKSVANLVIANTSSINAHGIYPITLQLLSTSTDDVTYISQWYATITATPKPRMSTISVDLMTSPQAISDLFKALEIGATFAVNSLPGQAPSPDWVLCVEGWKEVISATEWSVLINTSASVPVWKLEDPLYGGIDSVNRIAY
jgi:hypothetical protein